MLYLEGQFMFLTCTIVWKEPLTGTDRAARRGGTESAAAPEGGAARERPGHETTEREGAALLWKCETFSLFSLGFNWIERESL